MQGERIVRVPLWRRDGSVAAYALVDSADEGLAALRWYLGSGGYAMRQVRVPGGKMRAEYLHRRVLGLERGDRLEADHVDRDKLNNRRSNLRVVSRGLNEQNKTGVRASSGVRGVHWIASREKWAARVVVDGRMVVRGYFDTVEEAAVVVAALRKELHPCAPSAM